MLAQFANAHREKGKPERSVYDFHPLAEKPKPKARKATPEDLKRLFGG
jgi:hypothetical protein